MAKLIDKITSSRISRRGFMATASAGAATLALTGCTPKVGEDPLAATNAEEAPWRPASLEGGEWKTAACWLTCHCGCKNMAYVKDGKVIRHAIVQVAN